MSSYRADHRSRATVLVQTVIVLTMMGLVSLSLPATAADAQVVTETPVMKGPVLTQKQLTDWFLSATRQTFRAGNGSVTPAQLVNLYYEEGAKEGVAPDIAFVQAILETGWFSFSGSMVPPDANNFSGMGAYDGSGGAWVFKFPDVRTGVRAQMHHLRIYGDPKVNTTGANLGSGAIARDIENRYPTRWGVVRNGSGPLGPYHASATAWEKFGNGLWATDPDYGKKIQTLYGNALEYNGYARDAAVRANRITAALPPTGATPVMGDWNGDGTDTPGWFKDGTWALATPGEPLLQLSYGRAGDIPVVGDWNNDGRDTVGVVRGNTWILRRTYNRGDDILLQYGRSTDTPVVGDWNGDGRDTVGVVRGNTWILRRTYNRGDDIVLNYGRSTDTPVVGDWNDDGRDTVGVVRDNTWILRRTYNRGDDIVLDYGQSTDTPVVGDFNGDGQDTLGVRRGESWLLRYAYRAGADLIFYW